MEFWLTIFILPVVSFLIGIISGFLKRNICIASSISLFLWIAISLIVLDKSFIIWGIGYTLLTMSGNGLIWVLD